MPRGVRKIVSMDDQLQKIDEQIAALEEYAMGKTAAEFIATPTKAKDEHHTAVPDVEDLASTCTMDIGDFLASAQKAYDNAMLEKNAAAE